MQELSNGRVRRTPGGVAGARGAFLNHGSEPARALSPREDQRRELSSLVSASDGAGAAGVRGGQGRGSERCLVVRSGGGGARERHHPSDPGVRGAVLISGSPDSLLPGACGHAQLPFHARTRTCCNGLYRVNRNGRFNVPIGTRQNAVFDSDDFQTVSKALTRARIVCADFDHVIEQAGEGDFLFVALGGTDTLR